MFPFQIVLCAIALTGVTGERLRARAFFDAHNVKVGDPIVLTIDFIGEADFAALHPPALAKAVDRREFKVDDISARTDTFRDARRLTYRVRPVREGVLWFPALEFEYHKGDGAAAIVRSNPVPVHARHGEQVVVEGLAETEAAELPSPPPLLTEVPAGLDDDAAFAWRKACAAPSEAAFAAFDLPEARLNEAALAIAAGNWARALKLYSRLEWRIGQTEAVERGIVAALARKANDPAAELPVWRQVARPLLRHAWRGRLALAGGALVALVALFWLCGRAIRVLAVFALVAAMPLATKAEDPFAIFEQMEERMRQQMQRVQNSFSMTFGGAGEAVQEHPVSATVEIGAKRLQVGDGFDFIISLEAPKSCSIGEIQITPSEWFGLTVTGRAKNLADGVARNPSNAVKRLAVPVRYDVPFKGELSFTVAGTVTGRRSGGANARFFNFTFSNSFSCRTPPVAVDVKPLPTAGQSADFAGIIATKALLTESVDGNRVATNDVMVISYRLKVDGYLPPELLPEGVAYEWERGKLPEGSGFGEYVLWKRYFIADGAVKTPEFSVSYYDPQSRSYRRLKTGGSDVYYR